jgi:predicted PurR-regulated permease PerM
MTTWLLVIIIILIFMLGSYLNYMMSQYIKKTDEMIFFLSHINSNTSKIEELISTIDDIENRLDVVIDNQNK